MKRNPIESEISTHYSLFSWYQCDECGLEFRRESGFKRNVCFGFSVYWYLCESCAPTKEDAIAIFTRKRERPAPPKAPLPRR